MFPVNTTPNVAPEVLNYAPGQLNLFFCDILERGLDSMRSSIIGTATPEEPTPAGAGGDQTRYWLNQLGPGRKNNQHTWIRIGQALHSEYGEAGLPFWIDWTVGGEFPSSVHTAQDCWEAFAKFGNTSRYNLETIIHFATEDQEGGYWGANGIGLEDNQQVEEQKSSPARSSVNEPASSANQNGNQAQPPESARHASVARREPQGGLVDIIGPFTPMPDFYLDHVLGLLDSPETKVLFYMGRLVFGYFTKDQNGNMVPKLQDRIALSQLTDGRVTRDGKRLDHGTGLSERAVKKALRRLIDFGIVIKLSDNNSRNEGNLYALQLDFSKIDLEALANRKLEKEEKNRKRTESARQAKNKSQPENGKDAKSEVATASSCANSSQSEVTEAAPKAPAPAAPSISKEVPAPAPKVPAPAAPSKEVPAPAATRKKESKAAPTHESSPASPAPTTNEAFDATPNTRPAEKQEPEAPAREVPSAPVQQNFIPSQREGTVIVLPLLPSLQAFNNGLEQRFNEYTLQEMNRMAIERHQMTDEEMHQLIIKVNQLARIPPAFLYHTLIRGDATPPFVRTVQPAPATTPPAANTTRLPAAPPRHACVAPAQATEKSQVVAPSAPPAVMVQAPVAVDAPQAAPISDIAGILNALHTVNNEAPPGSYPLNGLEALARKLQARGETEDSVICAWQSCKQNGNRPVGAFITWINENFVPTTKSVDPRLRHWGAKNPNGGLISEYECARIPPTADQIEECMTYHQLREEGKSKEEIEEEMGIEIW